MRAKKSIQFLLYDSEEGFTSSSFNLSIHSKHFLLPLKYAGMVRMVRRRADVYVAGTIEPVGDFAKIREGGGMECLDEYGRKLSNIYFANCSSKKLMKLFIRAVHSPKGKSG